MLRKCVKNGTEIKMLEVIIGLILGLLIITSVYVVTFAVMFPRKWKLILEGWKILDEALKIIVLLTLRKILILKGMLK